MEIKMNCEECGKEYTYNRTEYVKEDNVVFQQNYMNFIKGVQINELERKMVCFDCYIKIKK
jgi:hypothetical protein